ncbi:DUF2938 domain-containing protein [Bowmanella dokdonensis]|uniref:DUF2938 domain-containing protein n=1 Tax=Bowmanella dokdonensis TaxID=751969 RepID=A0A939DS80_9ALTE|nr:DUF2938 domain-containing protein [Bowmanella dokdonensis]MBN7827708.1 DUF2938 domain-containing protein [Bowmanella dokdonensis]
MDTQHIGAVVIIGIGATLLMDGWAWLLRRLFAIPSLNFCLVGRWFGHMPTGIFRHNAIGKAEAKPFECLLGWTVHYLIGIVFAGALVWLTSAKWLDAPTLLPALLFGAVTVLAPFLVMQPALGMGLAASKAPSPWQARSKSLLTHLVFGLGLYLSAWLLNL